MRDAVFRLDENGNAVEQADRVHEARRFWSKYGHQLDLDATGVTLFAIACRYVLTSRLVTAADIGTTDRAMRESARAWAAAQVKQIAVGRYEHLDLLLGFFTSSRLEYDAVGVTAAQMADWQEAQAAQWWAEAQAGDGRLALRLVEYCERRAAYSAVTGFPAETTAKAELQKILTRYATRLVQQIETADHPDWAAKAHSDLQDFCLIALGINEDAENAGRTRPVDTTPWDFSDSQWDQMLRRGGLT